VAGPVDGWRERARRFVATSVEPIADAIDRDDAMPASLRAAVADAGFLGVGLPPARGGGGGTTQDVAAVLEEFATSSAAVATLISVHLSVVAAPIAEHGTAAQHDRYLRPLAEGRALGAFALTEPGSGSDAGALTTRYAPDGDGFRLDGAKMFITNAGVADTILLFATRDPALGHRGISAFLVPRTAPGYSVARQLEKLGLRGSETTEITLDHVHLGPDARLGPEGAGLGIALGALAGGRVGIAACALGVARGAYEEMVRNARAEPTDWKRRCVAQSFTELAAAGALVASAAAAKDAGAPFVEAGSAAKLFASTVAVRIAQRGFEVGGRPAADAGSRAGRLLRDARVFPIVEGTTEIQELILGRSLVGPPMG